ncbi:MAG: hypothetical protein FJ304_15560 [Planctomycetes bacterium]|nr:hypothetical protein [Planctomycetota bacterium]
MKLLTIEFTAPVAVVVIGGLLTTGLAVRADAFKGSAHVSAQESAGSAPKPTPAQLTPTGYSEWATNCVAKAHTCSYTYTNKDGGKSTQTVAIYAGDADRRGWAYYYNADKKAWARVAVPGNPKYDAKVMYWQKLKASGDGYEDFPTKGFCPTAKDGTSPIADLPLPPK